jgi:hypothetical protein
VLAGLVVAGGVLSLRAGAARRRGGWSEGWVAAALVAGALCGAVLLGLALLAIDLVANPL